MPHNVIEYSADLEPLPDFADVFRGIHAVLEEVAGARMANSKSRARAVHSYIGDGDPANAMVHLDVRLLQGRSDAVKAEVSARCLDLLQQAFSSAGTDRALQITVAVSDLQRVTYAKHPDGTFPDPSGGGA